MLLQLIYQKYLIKRVGEDLEIIDYPTAEKLEAEAKEKIPKIYLTITDSEGEVVRRISSNKNKGYHENYWDLRTFSQRNISEENNYSGPLVPPGSYNVHLEKFEDDKLEKLTDSYERSRRNRDRD